MSTARAIAPLPPEAIARLKASSHIATLSGVIIDLIKNSLDAGARNITIIIDFLRAGCVVEDDGSGIPAIEFLASGGLCKSYHTSRHGSRDDCYGRSGLYLASLSALSLLSISSKHEDHPSVHEISFHHGKAIYHHETISRTQDLTRGTRVAVRDLFGNMPVRVKQRALLTENSLELNRLWEQLRHRTLALLIAYGQPITVRVRDSEKVRGFSVSGARSSVQLPLDGRTSSGTSIRLRSVLSLLAQSCLTTPESWPSWVPASASSTTVTVKGAISLEPTASKNVQFISLGIHPVAQEQKNELYELINRLFSNSRFGVDDGSRDTIGGLDNKTKEARSNGEELLAVRAPKVTGKGVNRYPQFWLSIKLKNVEHRNADQEILVRDNILKDVVEVLEAMIFKWLDVNHFQPVVTRRAAQARRRERQNSQNGNPSGSLRRRTSFSSASANKSDRNRLKQVESRPDVSARTGILRSSGSAQPLQNRDFFGAWSRIKTSSNAFQDSLWQAQSARLTSETGWITTPGKARTTGSLHITSEHKPASIAHPASTEQQFDESRPRSTPGWDMVPSPPLDEDMGDTATGLRSSPPSPSCDQTMPWRDPYTDEVFLVNSRTGVIIADQSRGGTTGQDKRDQQGITLKEFIKPIRLARRPKSSAGSTVEKDGPGNWLMHTLESWSNPVFRPMEEQPIPAMEPFSLATDAHCRGPCLSSSHIGAQQTSRLDKAGLKSARVIAQVDKKFILTSLLGPPVDPVIPNTNAKKYHQTLALVDQHAASERVTLEKLFAQLFAPSSDEAIVATMLLLEPLLFTIEAFEHAIFEQYSRECALWGFTYTISSTTEPASLLSHRAPRTAHTVTVSKLPTIVASRILAEPKLVSDLLRAHIHDLHASNMAALTSADLARAYSNNSARPSDDPQKWLHLLPKMPRKLLDLVNSRSCRTAIMFNDKLSMDECRELVEELAKCVFPFVCAHGRPSAVVLGSLPGNGDSSDGVELAQSGSGYGTGFAGWMGAAGLR